MFPRNRLAGSSAAFVVQETHRPPAPVLRYIDQVVGLPQGRGASFRYSQGVLRRFDVDVIHVAEQHIETLLGTRGAGSLRQLAASALLIWNLRRHRIALVRTLHRSASRGRPIERLAQLAVDRATSAYVVFDKSTGTPDATRTVLIPHAHFRDRFIGYPRAEQVPGRMLCLASEVLSSSAVDMFDVLQESALGDVSLRIAGPAPDVLQASLHLQAERYSEIASVRIENLSDGARVQEIAAAELVMVPQTKSLEDLQLVFLALSLDRPVITPRTEAMDELSDSAGPGWVHLSEGPITAHAVDAAFESMRSPARDSHPNLSGRDLGTTRAAYERVFRATGASARTRVASRRQRPVRGTQSLGGRIDGDA